MLRCYTTWILMHLRPSLDNLKKCKLMISARNYYLPSLILLQTKRMEEFPDVTSNDVLGSFASTTFDTGMKEGRDGRVKMSSKWGRNEERMKEEKWLHSRSLHQNDCRPKDLAGFPFKVLPVLFLSLAFTLLPSSDSEAVRTLQSNRQIENPAQDSETERLEELRGRKCLVCSLVDNTSCERERERASSVPTFPSSQERVRKWGAIQVAMDWELQSEKRHSSPRLWSNYISWRTTATKVELILIPSSKHQSPLSYT